MLVTGAILVLLGVSVSASPFLPTLPKELIITKHKHGADEVAILPTPAGHSSMIENYVQKGTNVFFKPQFVLSSDKMPSELQPLIAAIEKDDCKKTYPLVTPVIVDEPLRVVEKEINGPLMTTIEHITEIKPAVFAEPVMPVAISSGPMLSPMELPQRPVMIEKMPIAVEMPYELPAPMAPVFLEVEEPKEIKVIPPGPVLPPMELSKLPLSIEKETTVTEGQIFPFAPVVELGEKLVEMPMMIPSGPILPPLEMPKLPMMVEHVPSIVELSHEHPIPVAPAIIPSGPVLPPLELPKLPTMVEHVPTITELPYEHPIPVAPAIVPSGPVLPPLEMPKLPMMVEQAPSIVELPHEHPIPVAPTVIPAGPVLPPLDMPKLPMMVEHVPSIVELPHEHPIPVVPTVVPAGPVLPPLEMSKIPMMVEHVPSIVELPHEIPPIPIAPGPVLPPLEMPKLPTVVQHVPSIVDLPHEYMIPMTPTFVNVELQKERVVPPAPVLPPLEAPMASVSVTDIEKSIHMVPTAPLMPALEMPTLPLTEIRRPAYLDQGRFVSVGLTYPEVPKMVVPEVPEVMLSSIPKFTKTKTCVDEIIVERVLPKMGKGIFTVPSDLPVPRILL